MTSENSPWPIRYQAASKLLDFVLSEELPSSPATKGRHKGLSDEAVEIIRGRILGIEPAESTDSPEPRISQDTLQAIREQVYGIYEPEASGLPDEQA